MPGALMGAIVESIEVRAELTRYEVPAWGVGELWTGGGLVLAHDFDFRADRGGGLAADPERWAASPDSVTPVGPSPPGGPSPLMGAHAPPAGTVRPVASRE